MKGIIVLQFWFFSAQCRENFPTLDKHTDTTKYSKKPRFLFGEDTPIYLSKRSEKSPYRVEYTLLKKELNNKIVYPEEFLGKNYVLRGSTGSRDMDESISRRDFVAAILKRLTLKFGPELRDQSRVPAAIYPEILVIMDHSLFSILQEDVSRAINYLLAFWSKVDMRYRSFRDPEIRLNIAGIIISTEEGGTPYIDDFNLKSSFDEKRQVDADGSLRAMSRYFYFEPDLPNHDLVMAMTQFDICNMVDSIFFGTICDGETLGYAYEAGACNRSSVDQNTEAVGIFEDNGEFSGIIPAAHELAHLLGAAHDEGACADGLYIMSSQLEPLELSASSSSWSNCTKKSLQQFFRSPGAACLYNKPKTPRGLPKSGAREIQISAERTSDKPHF